MKVVINTCFGGFSLSPFGETEYLKRKGKKAYFYRQTEYSYRDGKDKYERVATPDEGLFIHTVTSELGESISALPNDEAYFSSRDVKRDDPDLVAVVEEFGEKANSRFSELKVVEIPDGIEWEISEYDGSESIEEKHRSWS
jgi:hypothetical protein